MVRNGPPPRYVPSFPVRRGLRPTQAECAECGRRGDSKATTCWYCGHIIPKAFIQDEP